MLTSRLLAFLCALAIAPLATAQDSQSNADADEQIRAAVEAYVAAFNERDAAAVAVHWAEGAVYSDRETGDRVEGRAALQADFEGLFQENPAIRLAGEVDRVHLVTADVASVEGRSSVVIGEELPVETAFTATFGREGNEWLILSVEETELPIPESAYDALQPLAWLVGKWIDESDEARVETTVRWGSNGNFLIRSFVVSIATGPVREGTQVIGWDPRSHEIRSWTLATVDPPASEEVAAQAEWMALGTFAVTSNEQEVDPTRVIQLAVSKAGIISGTLYNTSTDASQAVQGQVDKNTQRVAFRFGDSDSIVVETGIYNLTQEEAPLLVHFGADRTENWLLVRLDQPADDTGEQASSPTP